jgi:succinate dehydrogenase/fumarate reductase flavoprotein subunit
VHQEASEALTRRDFLKGATAGAVLAGSATILGACADEPTTDVGTFKVNSPMPETWDYEADVVIVGYGGAGASAAIEAARAGASVILIEKAPAGEEGGNTAASGGAMILPDPTKEAELRVFLKAQMPDAVDDEEIAGFADEVMTNREWLEDLGAEYITFGPEIGIKAGGLYNELPGSESVPSMSKAGGPGIVLFNLLKDTVNEFDNIQVLSSTPGKRLIFDPVTKEVFGVWAEAGGKDIALKAKKGVILALGGFENNDEMKATYILNKVKIYPLGTPYNTGDGIAMVGEVGAKLRHFSSTEWGNYCCVPATEAIGGIAVSMQLGNEYMDNAIIVNKAGKRFVAEQKRPADGAAPSPTHDKESLANLTYSLETYGYPNLPCYMVFDETKRAAGPLMISASEKSDHSWCGVFKNYVWSNDNQAEINAGYIIKADTIEELAQKAGIDPSALAASVAKWNASVAAGVDEEFGRIAQMTPINNPPYYLTELGMTIINTQGGPLRNGKHEVIDTFGNIIPRLFAAGQFGSIYGFLYQGAGNVVEAVAGRTAGANAALLNAWDA